jgi:hypothetical protein
MKVKHTVGSIDCEICTAYLKYFLGGSLHSINENTENSIVASKKIGIEINSDKTKYMIMSRSECRMTSQYEG